jgi:hypothetical protein
MSNDLAGRLRAALRPVDPGEKFTRGVLDRIAREPARPARRVPGAVSWWVSGALVASIVLGVLVAHQRQAQRTQQGLEARRELIEALRVTSDKLDIAYRLVNDRGSADAAGEAGPES